MGVKIRGGGARPCTLHRTFADMVQLRRRCAVALSLEDAPVSAAELATRLGADRPAVLRALTALQSVGLARRVGENRRLARWTIAGPLANGEEDTDGDRD
jgi:DNA-binding IclR family transcriptional regulator